MAFLTADQRAALVRLAALTPVQFDLTADPPTVTLTARQNKSKKSKTNPLPSALLPDLADYLAGRPADLTLWPGTWSAVAAEMSRSDLIEAGIEGVSRDADGFVFLDFHAVGRHSLLTHVARTAPLHVAQKLAGHSIPLVTAKYTHAATDDLQAAVERLPHVAGGPGKVCWQWVQFGAFQVVCCHPTGSGWGGGRGGRGPEISGK